MTCSSFDVIGNCPICFDGIGQGSADDVWKWPCGHVAHKDCLVVSVAIGPCPICRQTFGECMTGEAIRVGIQRNALDLRNERRQHDDEIGIRAPATFSPQCCARVNVVIASMSLLFHRYFVCTCSCLILAGSVSSSAQVSFSSSEASNSSTYLVSQTRLRSIH